MEAISFELTAEREKSDDIRHESGVVISELKKQLEKAKIAQVAKTDIEKGFDAERLSYKIEIEQLKKKIVELSEGIRS